MRAVLRRLKVKVKNPHRHMSLFALLYFFFLTEDLNVGTFILWLGRTFLRFVEMRFQPGLSAAIGREDSPN